VVQEMIRILESGDSNKIQVQPQIRETKMHHWRGPPCLWPKKDLLIIQLNILS